MAMTVDACKVSPIGKSAGSFRQENPLRRDKVSVPQTDTGGREEYSKALG